MSIDIWNGAFHTHLFTGSHAIALLQQMTKGKSRLIVRLAFFCMCCCVANREVHAEARDMQPSDLPSRKSGCDWPGFLGPTGDGKSPETGLNLPWHQSGPPVVWHRRIGAGYAAPSVSGGRLFVFDRHGNNARLTCMRSETGEELWRFDYRQTTRICTAIAMGLAHVRS